MKEYQAYLFDLDGTLIDTVELIHQCFRHSLSTWFGLSLKREVILSRVGLPLEQQFKFFLTASGRATEGVDYPALCNFHMEHQLKIWHNYIAPFEGVKEVLSTLKVHRKKLAVVTSRYLLTAERYLKHTALWDFFSVVVTPELTSEHKPAPAPALKALEKLGLSPTEEPSALFIGDSAFDMQCAKRAGLASYLVLWGAGKLAALDFTPTYTEPDLRALVAPLKRG